MSVRFYDAHHVLVRTFIYFFSINFTCNSCFINIKAVHVWFSSHPSTSVLSITGSPEARMAPASRERNEKGDKYVVAVTPSRSPNRRCLMFILAVVALVPIAVLLATLIPIYVKGRGEDKSKHGKLIMKYCHKTPYGFLVLCCTALKIHFRWSSADLCHVVLVYLYYQFRSLLKNKNHFFWDDVVRVERFLSVLFQWKRYKRNVPFL